MSTNSTRLTIARTAEAPTTLALAGELDASSSGDLQAVLDEIGSEGRIIVDLSKVTFIDSSGLRVLVQAHTRGQGSDGGLLLRAPTARTVRLLEISGLFEHLDVELVADPRTV